MSLDDLRKQIDTIDDEIATLLAKRMDIVEKIGHLKSQNNSAVYRPEREKAIISRISQKLKNSKLNKKDIEAIFSEVFCISRLLEGNSKIAFLGPIGTYTYEAALSRFGKSSSFTPLNTIDLVFKEVSTNRAKFGVVPIENNTQGAVGASFDALEKYKNIKIIGEIYLDINHALCGVCGNLKDIKRIYSHSQAYGQCREFLCSHGLDEVQFIETDSTSKGAMLAKNDEFSATICSKTAAKLSALPIIKENIQDVLGNRTRFFVISLNEVAASGDDKTSILAITLDRPGALFELLGVFKEHGINITHLESRPVKRGNFESLFYLDFVGHKDNEIVAIALEKIKNLGIGIRVLGSYARSE